MLGSLSLICLPQVGYVRRKLLSSGWSLAQPEWNRRRRAVRIFHQHASGLAFDTANSPRSVSQQHNVVAIALDREIFVQRADHRAFGFRDHGVERASPEWLRRW